MVRVVFDTNVFVSAFIQPKSPPGRFSRGLFRATNSNSGVPYGSSGRLGLRDPRPRRAHPAP